MWITPAKLFKTLPRKVWMVPTITGETRSATLFLHFFVKNTIFLFFVYFSPQLFVKKYLQLTLN